MGSGAGQGTGAGRPVYPAPGPRFNAPNQRPTMGAVTFLPPAPCVRQAGVRHERHSPRHEHGLGRTGPPQPTGRGPGQLTGGRKRHGHRRRCGNRRRNDDGRGVDGGGVDGGGAAAAGPSRSRPGVGEIIRGRRRLRTRARRAGTPRATGRRRRRAGRPARPGRSPPRRAAGPRPAGRRGTARRCGIEPFVRAGGRQRGGRQQGGEEDRGRDGHGPGGSSVPRNTPRAGCQGPRTCGRDSRQPVGPRRLTPNRRDRHPRRRRGRRASPVPPASPGRHGPVRPAWDAARPARALPASLDTRLGCGNIPHATAALRG